MSAINSLVRITLTQGKFQKSPRVLIKSSIKEISIRVMYPIIQQEFQISFLVWSFNKGNKGEMKFRNLKITRHVKFRYKKFQTNKLSEVTGIRRVFALVYFIGQSIVIIP